MPRASYNPRMILAYIIGGFVAAFLVCWLCYIITMKGRDRIEATDCRPCQASVATLVLPFAVTGYVLDVGLNWTLFWVLGRPQEPTISARLKRMRAAATGGWRGWTADFICDRMLNPWDKNGHC